MSSFSNLPPHPRPVLPPLHNHYQALTPAPGPGPTPTPSTQGPNNLHATISQEAKAAPPSDTPQQNQRVINGSATSQVSSAISLTPQSRDKTDVSTTSHDQLAIKSTESTNITESGSETRQLPQYQQLQGPLQPSHHGPQYYQDRPPQQLPPATISSHHQHQPGQNVPLPPPPPHYGYDQGPPPSGPPYGAMYPLPPRGYTGPFPVTPGVPGPPISAQIQVHHQPSRKQRSRKQPQHHRKRQQERRPLQYLPQDLYQQHFSPHSHPQYQQHQHPPPPPQQQAIQPPPSQPQLQFYQQPYLNGDTTTGTVYVQHPPPPPPPPPPQEQHTVPQPVPQLIQQPAPADDRVPVRDTARQQMQHSQNAVNAYFTKHYPFQLNHCPAFQPDPQMDPLLNYRHYAEYMFERNYYNEWFIGKLEARVVELETAEKEKQIVREKSEGSTSDVAGTPGALSKDISDSKDRVTVNANIATSPRNSNELLSSPPQQQTKSSALQPLHLMSPTSNDHPTSTHSNELSVSKKRPSDLEVDVSQETPTKKRLTSSTGENVNSTPKPRGRPLGRKNNPKTPIRPVTPNSVSGGTTQEINEPISKIRRVRPKAHRIVEKKTPVQKNSGLATTLVDGESASEDKDHEKTNIIVNESPEVEETTQNQDKHSVDENNNDEETQSSESQSEGDINKSEYKTLSKHSLDLEIIPEEHKQERGKENKNYKQEVDHFIPSDKVEPDTEKEQTLSSSKITRAKRSSSISSKQHPAPLLPPDITPRLTRRGSRILNNGKSGVDSSVSGGSGVTGGRKSLRSSSRK